MLISKQTSDALDVLVGAFFDLNRTFDRCVSWMQNVWSMPQAADIIHHRLAHIFPIFADKITEIKDRYNMTSVYPQTHADSREYTDLQQMFDIVFQECAEVYTMFKMVKKTVLEHDDFNVLVDLHKIMRDYNEIIGQVYTLKDKAEQLPNNYDEYDRHITSWGIVGVEFE